MVAGSICRTAVERGLGLMGRDRQRGITGVERLAFPLPGQRIIQATGRSKRYFCPATSNRRAVYSGELIEVQREYQADSGGHACPIGVFLECLGEYLGGQ